MSLTDPERAEPTRGPGRRRRRARLLLGGRTGWRQLGSRAGGRINRMSYLSKWLILGSVIGVIAGLGAIVFYELLSVATHLLLGLLAGYTVPTPAGEGNAAGSAHYLRAWAIPLVVVAGGLLSGWIVFTWAPEAEGHGTDAAIDAVHKNPRGIRLRAVVVKIVASALTIGSGGSGGREGPAAQISAGFGSLLARALDLRPEDGRIAVAVGIGSGIGAIFSAPLGGAVLAADIVYREDFEFAALVPGMFASIIAYAVFGFVYGYRPLFALPGGYHFYQPFQLLWFAVIGVLAGGIGLLYSKGFYGIVELTERLPFTRKLRPAAGALAVGLIALWLPQVLGTGYGWVQKGISNELLHTPLYIILLLPFARILATALSIGTGGSGGVFGPGMVIGAFTGLAVWRIFEPIAPGLVGHSPGPFVVVGMMAVFGGISRAPLAVLLMVAEMTGSLGLLAPAMVALAISNFIVARTDDSIYRSQLRTRADSRAGRMQFGMPLLSTLDVASVAQRPRVVLAEGAPAAEALARLDASGVPGAPLVDSGGLYRGTVDRARLAGIVEANAAGPVERALDATTATAQASANLAEALAALTHAGGGWVPVTDRDRHVVGILSVSDLVRGYRGALDANFGRISLATQNAVTVEEKVGQRSPLVGLELRKAHLPIGSIVVTIQRRDSLIFATGATELVPGDVISALADPRHAEELADMIRGSPQPPAPAPQSGQMV